MYTSTSARVLCVCRLRRCHRTTTTTMRDTVNTFPFRLWLSLFFFVARASPPFFPPLSSVVHAQRRWRPRLLPALASSARCATSLVNPWGSEKKGEGANASISSWSRCARRFGASISHTITTAARTYPRRRRPVEPLCVLPRRPGHCDVCWRYHRCQAVRLRNNRSGACVRACVR